MRGHRTLVYVDDYSQTDIWGWFCRDCPESKFGFSSHIRPTRLAVRHEQETTPALQEAS